MRDIYRELLKRSVEDTASIAHELNDKHDDYELDGERLEMAVLAPSGGSIEKEVVGYSFTVESEHEAVGAFSRLSRTHPSETYGEVPGLKVVDIRELTEVQD